MQAITDIHRYPLSKLVLNPLRHLGEIILATSDPNCSTGCGCNASGGRGGKPSEALETHKCGDVLILTAKKSIACSIIFGRF